MLPSSCRRPLLCRVVVVLHTRPLLMDAIRKPKTLCMCFLTHPSLPFLPPLPPFHPPNSGYARSDNPYTFQVSMAKTCIADPCCCLASLVCPLPVACINRHKALNGKLDEYKCCQGQVAERFGGSIIVLWLRLLLWGDASFAWLNLVLSPFIQCSVLTNFSCQISSGISPSLRTPIKVLPPLRDAPRRDGRKILPGPLPVRGGHLLLHLCGDCHEEFFNG